MFSKVKKMNQLLKGGMPCFCCADIKRYRRAADDAERISQNIRTMIPFDSPECDEFRPVETDAVHIHFMCGTCFKMDHSLQQAEERLRKSLKQAVLPAREDKNLQYSILRLLQGYYPVTYRAFESFCQKGRKSL